MTEAQLRKRLRQLERLMEKYNRKIEETRVIRNELESTMHKAEVLMRKKPRKIKSRRR
jgi:hypothetical protein